MVKVTKRSDANAFESGIDNNVSSVGAIGIPPLAQPELADGPLSEIERIKAQIEQAKQALAEAKQRQKQSKPPTYKAMYKCPNCDCGGFPALTGIGFYCDKKVLPGESPAKCEQGDPWVSGRTKKRTEDGQLELIQAQESGAESLAG